MPERIVCHGLSRGLVAAWVLQRSLDVTKPVDEN